MTLYIYWIILFLIVPVFGFWKLSRQDMAVAWKWTIAVFSFICYSLIMLAIGALFEKGGFMVFKEVELTLPILIIVLFPAALYLFWEKLKKIRAEKAVLVLTGIIWGVSYIWIAFIGLASSLQFP